MRRRLMELLYRVRSICSIETSLLKSQEFCRVGAIAIIQKGKSNSHKNMFSL